MLVRRFICCLLLLVVSPWCVASPSESALKAASVALLADDPVAAEKILRPLAESGQADAQHLLGFLYDLGLAVPMDYKTGNSWQEKAAGQGHYWARLYLGWKLGLGLGVDQPDPGRIDALQAVLYERTAPARIVPEDWLGAAGLRFMPNHRRAGQWLRSQAEAGDALAAFTLAEYHYAGLVGGRKDPASHLHWVQASADRGYVPAMVRLKLYYGLGVITEKDEARSREYLRRAAEAGDADSQYELGQNHARGQNGMTKDAALARDWYAQAAAGNHIAAMNALADLLRSGAETVPRDPAAARQWSRRAADLGSAEALCDLAGMLRKGEGGEKDRPEAMRLYRLAADKNYAYGQTMVGWMLVHDTDEPDYLAARPWFELAAAAGSNGAMKELGLLLEHGRGTARDPVLAFEWYEKAARDGDAWAQNRVGWMLVNGLGVDRDEEEASSWFRLSIQQDFTPSMTALADLLRRDNPGVPKDQPEALRLYRKAADRGDAYGAHMVGWMITYGEAGDRDYAEARRWFEQAVNRNHVSSLVQIGLLHSEGRGTVVDQAEAYGWFLRAAEQGHAWAQNRVGWMLLQGTGIAVDPAAAVSWFRLAVAQGDITAMINLGRCHENGTGTPRDPAQAADCYRKAIAAGQASAVSHLARLALDFREQEQVALFREITPWIEARITEAEDWELGPLAGVLLHNGNPLGNRGLGQELLDRAETNRQRATARRTAPLPPPKIPIKIN